jgi:hypothetical protein
MICIVLTMKLFIEIDINKYFIDSYQKIFGKYLMINLFLLDLNKDFIIY